MTRDEPVGGPERPLAWWRAVAEWSTEVLLALDRDGDSRHHHEAYRAVLDRSPEAVVVHDGTRILHANPLALQLLAAHDVSEVVGREMDELVDTTVKAGTTAADRLPALGEPIEVQLSRLDGGTFEVEVASIPALWRGEPAVQSILRDVSARHRADMVLLHRATHDPLTGLPNRSLLEDRLAHAVARSGRTQRQLAVLFVDLDRFKAVNDSAGHEVGDDALRQVAQRLTAAVRPGDTVARLGGDEFVVVVEDLLVADTVELVVERIRAAFDQPFGVGGRSFAISASVGVLVAGSGDDPQVMLRNADAAMYSAKARGRGGAARFDLSMRDQANDFEETGRRLRAAIDEHHIHVVYQPLVRLSDGKVVAVEALMRWHHPERGVLLPDAFLDVAERAGLLPQLGEQVIAAAVAWMAHRTRRGFGSNTGPTPWLAVNLATTELHDPRLARMLTEVLDCNELPPEQLCVELQEPVLLDDPVRARERLAPLRSAGVKLAIDDFGKGYASLAVLREFRPEHVKIDRSLVKRILESPNDAASVRAVTRMAHALGISVTAEGVESAEQAHLLELLGCEIAQGNVFAVPGEPEVLAPIFGAPLNR